MAKSLELVHKAYCLRLKWVTDELENRQSESLVQHLRLALINTQVSAKMFQDYLQACCDAAGHVSEERVRLEADRKQFDNQIKSSQVLIERIVDTELRAPLEKHVISLQDLLVNLERIHDMFVVFSSFFLNINVDVASERLAEIYEGDDADYIYGAFQKFVEYLLGLTPPGWLIGGFSAIYNVINARRIAVETTDKYMSALEAYNFTITQWCIVCQVLMDSVIDIRNVVPVDFSNAADKVQARFELYFEHLQKETDKGKVRKR